MSNEELEASSVAELALLGQLLEEHRSRLLAMLQRRIDPGLRQRIDPEDVLAQAFFQARRRWTRYRSESKQSPYSWLYRIVLDCLIEAWRRETCDRRNLQKDMPWPEESSVQLGLQLISPGTSPSDAMQRQEMQQRIRALLELLSEDDREVLRMRHEDELTHVEVGEVLGISENAATMRYVRALKRLRKLWRKINPESHEEAP